MDETCLKSGTRLRERGKKALLNAAQLHSVYEREESAISFVVRPSICSGHAMNSESRIS